jgi:hypothetical protein
MTSIEVIRTYAEAMSGADVDAVRAAIDEFLRGSWP